MMAIRSVNLLSLLYLCSGASAQEADPFPALEFFPRPVTEVHAPNTGLGAAPRPAPPRYGPPGAAPSSEGEPLPDELVAEITGTVESTRTIEARDGPRGVALGEELVTLATLYREAGDHLPAIGTLQRALDVVRVNYGLFSLEQVPIIEGIIESRMALGDYTEAAELDEFILELVFRNHDDRRVADILVAVANREMEAVNRFLEHGSTPQITINIGTTVGPDGEPEPALTGRRAALVSLRRARRHYNQAIALARVVSADDIAELFAIEEKMIQTFYVEVTNPDLRPSRSTSLQEMPTFRPGEAAFQAHVTNSMNLQRTAAAVARALLRLGDWQLLFSRNGTALDTYQTAHDLLVREGAAADTIDELLSPAVPVTLPMPGALPYDAGEPASYRGFVDISFVVGRYGSVRGVEVVGASADTPKEILKRAERHAALSRIRPRFADGVPARRDHVDVRYYYDY